VAEISKKLAKMEFFDFLKKSDFFIGFVLRTYLVCVCVINVYFRPLDQHFRVILLVNSARTVFGNKLHFWFKLGKVPYRCQVIDLKF
jgi:hypothetical protein